MKVKSYPIMSKATIDLIGTELKKKSECHYIIFKILLETGMPLDVIPTLRCIDIDKNAIAFRPAHKFAIRTSPLSENLQKEIAEYLNGRHDESYAFPMFSDSSKPIYLRTFQAALDAVSKQLSLDPPCTSTSLKKTYVLKLFKEGNIDKIYEMTTCRSVKQIYEYLGVDVPVMKNEKYLQSNSNYDILMHHEVIFDVKERVDAVLDEIDRSLENKSAISYEYCCEVLRLAHTLDDSIERFKALTSDKELLKKLYTKSGDADTIE